MKPAKVLNIEDSRKGTVLFLVNGMDDELAHRLLGQVLKRIKEFSIRYDSDADGKVLARAVEIDFASRGGEFLIGVFFKDGTVTGHILVKKDFYYGNFFAYVHQMEIDRHSGVTRQQEIDALHFVEQWARGFGAKKIKAALPSDLHVRRLKMLYQFKPSLTIANKEIVYG